MPDLSPLAPLGDKRRSRGVKAPLVLGQGEVGHWEQSHGAEAAAAGRGVFTGQGCADVLSPLQIIYSVTRGLPFAERKNAAAEAYQLPSGSAFSGVWMAGAACQPASTSPPLHVGRRLRKEGDLMAAKSPTDVLRRPPPWVSAAALAQTCVVTQGRLQLFTDRTTGALSFWDEVPHG